MNKKYFMFMFIVVLFLASACQPVPAASLPAAEAAEATEVPEVWETTSENCANSTVTYTSAMGQVTTLNLTDVQLYTISEVTKGLSFGPFVSSNELKRELLFLGLNDAYEHKTTADNQSDVSSLYSWFSPDEIVLVKGTKAHNLLIADVPDYLFLRSYEQDYGVLNHYLISSSCDFSVTFALDD